MVKALADVAALLYQLEVPALDWRTVDNAESVKSRILQKHPVQITATVAVGYGSLAERRAKAPEVIPISILAASVSTDAVQQHAVANDWTTLKGKTPHSVLFCVTMIIILTHSKWFFCQKC
ncbi:hypothetical protein U9513_13070 [Escherichia coli]|uniref:hypothetical protein n=1 Tax=Escherichia coli TaxID=562 RepID=UPI000C7D3207|nr:hypothetical protein [Escherichia coli]ELV1750845.1 hypothetical protein [Escherichia coli]PLA89642.1 hypothetical protein CYR80_09295 [Escherichia coli]HAV8775364.1 hypothetical protein [Escherichia coli]